MMDESNFQVPSIPVLHVPTLIESTDDEKTNQEEKIYTTDTRIVKSVPLPKLCPSCSVILLQYLKPLQMYLNQMINLTTGLSSGVDFDVLSELKKNLMDGMPSASSESKNDTSDDESVHCKSSDSCNTSSHSHHQSHSGQVDHSSGHHYQQQQHHSHSGRDDVKHGAGHHHHQHHHHQRDQHQQPQQQHARWRDGQQEQQAAWTNTSHDSKADQGDHVTHHATQSGDKSNSASGSAIQGDSYNTGNRRHQHHHGDRDAHSAHHSGSSDHDEGDDRSSDQRRRERGHSGRTGEGITSDRGKDDSDRARKWSHGHSVHGKQESRGDVFDQHSPSQRKDSQARDEPHQGHERQVHRATENAPLINKVHGNSHPTSTIGTWRVQHKDFSASSDTNNHIKVPIYDSPYAFVTIIYDDLSAINAIILANSLILSSKKQLQEDNYIYSLPFVAVLSGNINSVLLDYLPNVFDEVLSTRHDIKLSLLSDASFGVTQLKVQLWQCLSRYTKCFFIESTSLIVGEIDDVFTQFNELSACVDWRFPDSFACSVFLLEPNEKTFHEMTKFATQLLTTCDDPELTSVDEMTILNQFFANKWNKMSFIYNFSQNSLIYTQQPAFMKFGGSVKIVNFSFSPISAPMNSEFTPEAQPWHVQFNLNQCTMSGEIHLNTSVNNYIKFYLSIFIKRVWPLLRHSLTPKIQARGKQDWSIYEIVSLLRSPSSMFDSSFYSYSPITLRRIDPSIHRSNSNSIASASISGSIVDGDEDNNDHDDEDEEDDNADTASVATIVNRDDESSLISGDNQEVDDALTGELEASASSDEKEAGKNLVHDSRSEMRAWESGRVDWMGVHRSDRIIDMLCDKINTKN